MKRVISVGLGLAMVFMMAGASLAGLDDGLVAYYPFSGNANDSSGNGNNGTVNGATIVPDKFGNANSAYSFNGANSYIYIGKPVPSSIATKSEVTIAAWINPSTYPASGTYGTIVSSQCDSCIAGATISTQGGNGHGGIHGGILFQIGLESIGFTVTAYEGTTNVAVPLNQWSHIVATWKSGDTKKVYINGQLVTNWTTILTGNIKYNTNTELDIGRQSDYPDRYFNGLIDDVRIYNRALSASEILQLYRGQGTCSNSIVTFTAGTPAKAADVNANFDAHNCQIQALKAIVCQDHPTASICQ
jgi:hypothetical protein